MHFFPFFSFQSNSKTQYAGTQDLRLYSPPIIKDTKLSGYAISNFKMETITKINNNQNGLELSMRKLLN